MGIRNHLVEGVSCTGKTSVCRELQRRGYQAVNGDTDLAYQGNPHTGEPTEGFTHEHHIWDVAMVEALVADRTTEMTFLCGGSRNWSRFIQLFDEVFVLDIDRATLVRRLDERPAGEWGGKAPEREVVLRLHQTQEDIPRNGVLIDATAPLAEVVDEILRRSGPDGPGRTPPTG
jgi:thymidylate kinase